MTTFFTKEKTHAHAHAKMEAVRFVAVKLRNLVVTETVEKTVETVEAVRRPAVTVGNLADAARAGDTEKLSEMLKTATDVDINGDGSGFPLAAAIEFHQLKTARLLLDAGACVGACYYRAYRIAHRAKDEAAIKLLAQYPGKWLYVYDANERTVTMTERDNSKIADSTPPPVCSCGTITVPAMPVVGGHHICLDCSNGLGL